MTIVTDTLHTWAQFHTGDKKDTTATGVAKDQIYFCQTIISLLQNKEYFKAHLPSKQKFPGSNPVVQLDSFPTWLAKCIFGSVKARHMVSNPFKIYKTPRVSFFEQRV